MQFVLADKNKDGAIDVDELQSFLNELSRPDTARKRFATMRDPTALDRDCDPLAFRGSRSPEWPNDVTEGPVWAGRVGF
jgi:EF hand domain-containing protein